MFVFLLCLLSLPSHPGRFQPGGHVVPGGTCPPTVLSRLVNSIKFQTSLHLHHSQTRVVCIHTISNSTEILLYLAKYHFHFHSASYHFSKFFSVPSRLKSRVDFYHSPLSDIQLMLLLKLILFVGIFACTTACVAVRGQPERVCSLLPCRCHG